MPSVPRTPTDRGRRDLATLLVALAALATAVYAVATRPAANAPAPAPSTPVSDADARRAIADLSRRIDALGATPRGGGANGDLVALAARVAALEGRLAVDAGAPPSSSAAPAGGPTRRFATLRSPNPAITIREDATGGITVTNTDPSLTGQRLEVTGETADGRTERFHIIVPPP
jgi:hypothetical protein